MNQHDETATSSESDFDSDEKNLFLPSNLRIKTQQRHPLKWLIVILFLIIGFLTTALFYQITPLHREQTGDPLHPPDKHDGKWTNCGPTIDTALERGCIFDIMGNNWIPPLCHDTSFAKTSATTYPKQFNLPTPFFPWYESNHSTSTPIPSIETYLITQARSGFNPPSAYTTESWHIAHCLYWLSVGVNAMDRLNKGERDIWVPRVVRKPGHARHCSMITGHLWAEEESLHESPITPRVDFGFATCVRLA